MDTLKFYNIAFAEGEIISIPNGSHFSIGTSPYYAHQHGLAIDIYPKLTLKNYSVYSPVSGRIISLKTLGAPKPNFSVETDKEYLIIIRRPKNPNIMFKILHIKSNLKEGVLIEKGTLLGQTIKNGYFVPWSRP
jgi:hypothetical protein